MSTQYTLAIIKPNAVKNKHAGVIISQIEKAGFVIKKLYLTKLSLAEAQAFYKEHAKRFFYNDLCVYMSSGSVIAMVLQKDNAVEAFRALIGDTDPKQAKVGTLRYQFGTSIDRNAIHGSDAEVTAKGEIDFFFTQREFVKHFPANRVFPS